MTALSSVRVVGSNLDALIAVLKLTEKGYRVHWDSLGKPGGGFFRGFDSACGQVLDYGMMLLEPDHRGCQRTPISLYSGQAGSQARPFLAEAYEWLESRFGALATCQVYTIARSGVSVGDYFISDDLSGLELALGPDLNKAINQLREIVDLGATELHPSLKMADVNFKTLSLSEVVRSQLGERLFAALFEDFLSTVTSGRSDLLAAADHRLAWLPMYWPETIMETLMNRSQPETMLPIEFFVIEGRSMAHQIRSLDRDVRNHSLFINEHDSEPLRDIKTLDFSKNVVDDSSNTKKQDTSDVSLVHFCAKVKSDSTMFFQEPQNNCYRINSRKWDDGKTPGSVVFEFGHGDSGTDQEFLERAIDLAKEFGIQTSCGGENRRVRIPLSRSDTLVRLNEYDPAQGFHGRNLGHTFNDQLVRGLGAVEFIERQM